MRNNILVGLLASFISSSAFAAPCNVPGKVNTPKWQVPLTVHELVKSAPVGTTVTDVASWSFGSQSSFFSKFLQDSPDEACNVWALGVSPDSTTFTPAMRSRNKAFPNGSTFICAFDCDNDNDVDATDENSSCASLVGRETKPFDQPTDPICDRDSAVHGPYDDGSTGYVRGKEFTDTQKSDFRIMNRARQPDVGTLKSDAYPVPIYDPTLKVWFEHGDFDQFLSNPSSGQPDAAQIDHLVPRVDVHGCGCGTNSPRNAAAVSAQLNNGMSNDPGSPTRVGLLCHYAAWPGCPTTPYPMVAPGSQPNPVSGALAPTTNDVEDAGSDASHDENGGCAAGDATGGASALALIGLVGFVQRRKRA